MCLLLQRRHHGATSSDFTKSCRRCACPGTQCHDIFGQRIFVISPARYFALRRSLLAEHPADPAFGYCQLASDMINAAPSPRRAQKFPRAASWRISLSSVRSEIARRSRVFSFSRSFIRRA